MKKVFLSLAVIAALTVVSCKQADANADAAVDSTTVETTTVDTAAVDSATTALDTAAAKVEEAGKAVDAAKEEVKK